VARILALVVAFWQLVDCPAAAANEPWVANVLDPASQNLKMVEDIQRVQRSLSSLHWITGGILLGSC